MIHSDKNLSRTRRAITLLLLLTARASAGTLPGTSGRAHPQGGFSGASRQPRDKVSPGLRERMRGARRGGEKVSVILRLGAKPTGRLNALLNRSGVRVKGDFKSFNAMAVEELAGFGEVEVVTPDEEVRFLGFVEGATGAREMRGRDGNSGLRGKDMNIAVLDSGIDKDHHGVSDIAFQKEFTGEGTTGDPYGHGTHVASLAAAPNHISHGAYTGLAPEAKVINLCVLNSQGVGQLNLDGAVQFARLIRTDLTNQTPLGAPLLVAGAAPPPPYTTIAGHRFPWSQGVLQNQGYVTGTDLVTKYQRIYNLGAPFGAGVMMSDGVMVSDGVMDSDSIWAFSVLVNGDGTKAMPVVYEDGTEP